MINLYPIFILFVLTGGWVFISNYKHMLTMLMSLEIIMLGLYAMINNNMIIMNNESMLLLFLTFMVCESSVGLSLLVNFVRTFGTDLFKNMSSTWS